MSQGLLSALILKHRLSMGESSACNTQGAKQMLQGQVKVDLFYLLIHIHNVDHFTLETL